MASNAPRLAILGSPMSQPTRMALWTARALGVDAPLTKVDAGKGEHRSAEFLRKNPNARFPVLVDGEFVVYESNAIAQYLVAQYGGKSPAVAKQLVPEDARARAHVQQWLDWKHGALRSGLAGIVRRRVLQFTMKDISQHSMSLDFKEIPESRQVRELLESMRILEQQLVGTGAFLVPGTTRPTLADVAVFEEVDQLRVLPAGKPLPDGRDLAAYPNVAAWAARVKAGVPGYDDVHKELNAAVAGLDKQREAQAKSKM